MSDSLVSVKEVNKTYKRGGETLVVLDNLNLEVPKGDFLALMGPSGSGKSTLLNLIGGLDTPTSGNVEVDGERLDTLNSKALSKWRASHVGFIFQFYNLLPVLTAFRNVELPLLLTKLSGSERRQHVETALNIVSLEDRASHKPNELSGGQQQRVGIARSLAVEPDVWFLDEPFSALDPLIRKEMQDEFLRLQEKLKKTIMFITHDFDEALRLADRIAIMKDGIIEQLDTPAKIVLNPATEYVRKFTEEVPREKVLKIEAVMDPVGDVKDLSDLKVSKNEIIENVAEKILTQEKSVGVTDENNKIVGTVHPSKIIHTVFGGRKNND